MYGSLIEKSVLLEECFADLLKRINIEVKKCKEANEIGGILELLAA